MLTLFTVCLLSIAYCYILYPVLLAGLSLFAKRRLPPDPHETLPDVSHVIVVRNSEKSIQAKIENSAGLDYPTDKL